MVEAQDHEVSRDRLGFPRNSVDDLRTRSLAGGGIHRDPLYDRIGSNGKPACLLRRQDRQGNSPSGIWMLAVINEQPGELFAEKRDTRLDMLPLDPGLDAGPYINALRFRFFRRLEVVLGNVRPGFEQQHFQSSFRQFLHGKAAGGPRPDHDRIVRFGGHLSSTR
jgi:hypothetical protein